MRAMTVPTSAVALLALGLSACASEETVQGECRDVFGGDICTWGTMVGDDVSAFGATVALASIENAPADAEMVSRLRSSASSLCHLTSRLLPALITSE